MQKPQEEVGEQPAENKPAEVQPAPKKEEVGEQPASTEGLVKMSKGDETLDVHPSTVKDHAEAGWEVV